MLSSPNLPAADRHSSVRYCKTPDGVSLAIFETGAGPPVVKVSNWMSQFSTDFQNPIWSKLFGDIADQCSVIRYDGRGVGRSERSVGDISFEEIILDLETVMVATGLEKVSLLGMSMGAATAIAYAHRHPDRVHRLALHGPDDQMFCTLGAGKHSGSRCRAGCRVTI